VVAFSAPLLGHALTYAEGENGLLFRPWGNVRRDLAAACARAGIPPVTPNDLRRTYATWWRHHGVATHDIAALLGHRDSRMVERVYGRTDAQSLGRSLQRRMGLSQGPSPAREVSVNHSRIHKTPVAHLQQTPAIQRETRHP
jgi:hypothetical protein